MTDELQCLLRKKVWPFNKTCRELIALRLVALGLEGEIRAIQYIYDRLDGKPPQAVELTGDERKPLRLTYVIPNEGKDGSSDG